MKKLKDGHMDRQTDGWIERQCDFHMPTFKGIKRDQMHGKKYKNTKLSSQITLLPWSVVFK